MHHAAARVREASEACLRIVSPSANTVSEFQGDLAVYTWRVWLLVIQICHVDNEALSVVERLRTVLVELLRGVKYWPSGVPKGGMPFYPQQIWMPSRGSDQPRLPRGTQSARLVESATTSVSKVLHEWYVASKIASTVSVDQIVKDCLNHPDNITKA